MEALQSISLLVSYSCIYLFLSVTITQLYAIRTMYLPGEYLVWMELRK